MLPDGVEAEAATGIFRRTVHLGYDIFVGTVEAIPDITLTPADGDALTVVQFKDKATGESHFYVLNEEYRRGLIEGLTGGIVPVTDLHVIRNGG